MFEFLGPWSNGMTSVLQTESEGSIPSGSITAAVADSSTQVRLLPAALKGLVAERQERHPRGEGSGASSNLVAGSKKRGSNMNGRGLKVMVGSSILRPQSSNDGWEAHLEERWCEAPEEVSSTLTPTTIAKWCKWQHARL